MARGFAAGTLRAMATEPAPGRGLVDAAPVRAHLELLAEAKVGLRTVAELTGVDRASLHRIRTGRATAVRPATADAVLAVQPGHVAAGSTVDAAATHERIGELLAAGWTRTAIADRIGMKGRLRVGERRVLASTAAAVEALWAQHFGSEATPSPPLPPRTGRPDYEDLFEAIAEICDARRPLPA